MNLHLWKGLARTTDPETSHEAAETDVTRLQMIVLREFQHAKNGLTAEELSDRLPNIPLNTITPRIAPLVRKGYLIPTGKRMARSGRNQRVLEWVDDTEEQSLDYFNRYIAGDR